MQLWRFALNLRPAPWNTRGYQICNAFVANLVCLFLCFHSSRSNLLDQG